MISRSRITLTLIIVNIFCFIVFYFILDVNYLFFFVQINSNVINDLELWRLFTSIFLHADIMHIFSNMIALLIFGAAVENNYKRYQYIIIYFISGLIGNLFSLILWPPDSISLGASGAIFGLMGAAFILFAMEGDKSILYLGLLYLIYFIIASLAPGIDLWAHLFGLLSGLLFGYLIKSKKRRIYEDY